MPLPALPFRRVGVYCGSNLGRDPAFARAAREFGALLATRGVGIVYGGGRVGLMGALADGALAAGGEVIGVIPEKLRDLEVAHGGLTRLEVVSGMHPRKLRMAELADAFIALPGGYGTLEELFEVTTWTQLEYHHKPVGLLDVGGYWSPLAAFLDQAVEAGFVRGVHRGLVVTSADPVDLLARLERVEIPEIARWIDAP